MLKLSRYRKTAAALIGGGLTWFDLAYVPDGHVTRVEWYALAVVTAGALGVYGVTNEPADPTPPPTLVGPVEVPGLVPPAIP